MPARMNQGSAASLAQQYAGRDRSAKPEKPQSRCLITSPDSRLRSGPACRSQSMQHRPSPWTPPAAPNTPITRFHTVGIAAYAGSEVPPKRERRPLRSRSLILMQQLAHDFWNLRGTFKVAGLLDVGTQLSVVRRSNGRFLVLDSYTPSEPQRQALQGAVSVNTCGLSALRFLGISQPCEYTLALPPDTGGAGVENPSESRCVCACQPASPLCCAG